MVLTKILTYVFYTLSIFMGYYLYSGIRNTIDEENRIDAKEVMVIEKLKLIREAEIIYHEVNSRYTDDWEELARFIEEGRVPIIERKEEIVQKDYGGEEVTVHIDTLGYMPTRKLIFHKEYNINASEEGTFVAFETAVGEKVLKNQHAYAISVDGKIKKPPLQEEGVVISLTNIAPGVSVTKGQNLLVLSKDRFGRYKDLSRLGYRPGTNIKFDIFVGVVNKSGIDIDVIEVKDPKPDDPQRREDNSAGSRKPLRFGSAKDVSTAGNWE